MDKDIYEYQSYTLIRRRMKDRGALFARCRSGRPLDKGKDAGIPPFQVTVMTRQSYQVRRFWACVQSSPFLLRAPCLEQDQNK